MVKATTLFMRGLKLALILLLGGLIMLLPRIVTYLLALVLLPWLSITISIICALLGLFVSGWLITKFKNWIFK